MSKIKFFSDKLFIKKNKKNIISSFNKVINSGNFILGNNVKKFENQFSKLMFQNYIEHIFSSRKLLFQTLLKRGSFKG